MQEEYSKLFEGQDWELQLIMLSNNNSSSKSFINTCSDLTYWSEIQLGLSCLRN